MQAPGGKGEDPSGGFVYEGWTVPYFDEAMGEVMSEQMGQPFELLLGRRTYDIFAAYWPKQGNDDPAAVAINHVKKYVVSHRPIFTDWEGTILIEGDAVEEIKKLKEGEGPMLQVHGSSDMIQTLLANELVDELWLKIFPVVLGSGKRLFGCGTRPETFKLVELRHTPSGVIIANYRRAGEVKTGSFT